jgi:hypothetical protein
MSDERPPSEPTESSPAASARLILRHLRFGWWSLLCFLTLGLGLEVLHGLKVGWYLDSSQEVRRMMWTLAHAHGTLLALVNLAFASSVRLVPGLVGSTRLPPSPCLIGATVLLPGGFFLGGAVTYSGDPGLGVVLVPVGAVLLVAGVLSVALGLRAQSASQGRARGAGGQTPAARVGRAKG